MPIFLEQLMRRNYCMVGYMDHDFELYKLATGLLRGTNRLRHDYCVAIDYCTLLDIGG